MSDPRCAKCGHPRSNHPYRHMFVGPFVGPSKQDTIDPIQAERDAWKARAEAAEAALTRALGWERDDAVKPNGLTYKPTDVLVAEMHMARQDIRTFTPPADLAKGVADD